MTIFSRQVSRLVQALPAYKNTGKVDTITIQFNGKQSVDLLDPTEIVFDRPDLFKEIGPRDLRITHGELNADTTLVGPDEQIWLKMSPHGGLGFI